MTPDQPSDPDRIVVELPSGPAHVTDVGSGPCIVAVHGLPGSVRDFRWLGAALEGQVRLVRVDMPGFGDTPLSTEPSPAVAARGRFVASLIETMEIERPVLIGHSIGGTVVAEVAARHGHLIRGAGLLASVGHKPHQSLRAQPVPRQLVSWLLRVPWLRRALTPKLVEGYQRAGFKGHGIDELVHCSHCLGALRFSAHADNLSKMAVPTLVAWTEDDAFVESRISEALYWRCPPGPRIAFSDGGHNLQKTRAIELGSALSVWVEQLYR